jgi:predicted secreted protein
MPRSRAALVIAVLATMGALTLGGLATPAQAKPVAPTITITILPAQVRLVPGEAVAVRLDTNVTTGYSWSATVVGDRSAVDVSKGVYAAPTAQPGLVGAAGTTTWIVTAKATGTAVVKFWTTPPGGGQRQRAGSLTVIVRS